MDKIIKIVVIIPGVFLVGFFVLANIQQESSGDKNLAGKNNEESLVECLKRSSVVIYGSKTCSACARLHREYEKYPDFEIIYVECTQEMERCNEEMLVGYVPAIQIDGELFDGWGSPENLAKETNCPL